MSLIIILFIAFFLFEIFLIFYLKKLRFIFQWLIIKEIDLSFKFSKEKIEKFKKNSFEPNLGWETRPNIIKTDYVKSFGEKSSKKFKKVKYSHNKRGARLNPYYENYKEKIISFGDSFVYNRHVNDGETWQHYLSKLTKSNVSNFGVGNFGLDQSILRMKKIIKNEKDKIIIMGFVPETIVRIHSVWRHFYEYGNIFAFKPRYKLKNNRLKIVHNPIKNFSNIKKIYKKIDYLKQEDHWYRKKFKSDLIQFPYILSIFKNFPRNILIIFYLSLYKIFSSVFFYNKAWEITLKNNFNYVIESYKDKSMVDLLAQEIKFFSKKVLENNCKPLVIIFPYLNDMRYIINTDKVFYKNLLKEISRFTDYIDLSEEMRNKKNMSKLFVNSFYGGHLSKKGNKMTANIIHSFLKKNPELFN